jgi:adenine-specific DNA methylase
MSHPIKSPRKLIEVALPLDAINVAAGREKSIRQGHPSTLHLWWARRPLAAARAVIFAQLVNDPSYQQGGGFKYGKNKKEAAVERKRLFKIIEDLVLWENTTNEEVLERARVEIRRSWREVCELNKDHPQATELFNPDKLPALHDPFAGGGSIPLEAQRLGLESHASDLNPVPILINKAMIEIPPKFANRQPVGKTIQNKRGSDLNLPNAWTLARGLAEDVRRYGDWINEQAKKQIGHLYPLVEITKEMANERPDLKPLAGFAADGKGLDAGGGGALCGQPFAATGQASHRRQHAGIADSHAARQGNHRHARPAPRHGRQRLAQATIIPRQRHRQRRHRENASRADCRGNHRRPRRRPQRGGKSQRRDSSHIPERRKRSHQTRRVRKHQSDQIQQCRMGLRWKHRRNNVEMKCVLKRCK